MSNQGKMKNAAYKALTEVFEVSARDKVLILTDIPCRTISDSFKLACSKIGCIVEEFEIEENKRPLTEIPPDLLKLLPGKTVVMNILKAFSEEINFRIQWIFKVEEGRQRRLGHMPGITEEMMYRSVNVDYHEMRKTANLLMKELKK